MAKCKDCLHNTVCELWRKSECQDANSILTGGNSDCPLFVSSSIVDDVVRCKDCARSKMILDIIGNPRLFCTCWRGNPEVEFDDFCSYGERKEDNH